MGATSEIFTIHDHLLKDNSSFFRERLFDKYHDWNGDKVVQIDDADANHFQVYVHWLYHGKIDCHQAIDAVQKLKSRVKLEVLIHCYLLGDTLGTPAIKNNVIDQMIEFNEEYNNLPRKDLITHVYRETQQSSKLRKLIVDLYVWTATAEDIESLDDTTTPFEFVCDAFKTHFAAVRAHESYDLWVSINEATFQKQKCGTYHEHAEGEQVPCDADDTEDGDDAETEPVDAGGKADATAETSKST